VPFCCPPTDGAAKAGLRECVSADGGLPPGLAIATDVMDLDPPLTLERVCKFAGVITVDPLSRGSAASGS
jgi:hypothetical protein